MVRGRCLLWKPRDPLGARSLVPYSFQISIIGLIKYFWKLSPDDDDLIMTYRALHAFVSRTLPPLETTHPAGHAILRSLHHSNSSPWTLINCIWKLTPDSIFLLWTTSFKIQDDTVSNAFAKVFWCKIVIRCEGCLVCVRLGS